MYITGLPTRLTGISLLLLWRGSRQQNDNLSWQLLHIVARVLHHLHDTSCYLTVYSADAWLDLAVHTYTQICTAKNREMATHNFHHELEPTITVKYWLWQVEWVSRDPTTLMSSLHVSTSKQHHAAHLYTPASINSIKQSIYSINHHHTLTHCTLSQ